MDMDDDDDDDPFIPILEPLSVVVLRLSLALPPATGAATNNCPPAAREKALQAPWREREGSREAITSGRRAPLISLVKIVAAAVAIRLLESTHNTHTV